MKKHIPTASAILSFSLLFTGCAHSYTLDSMEERPEYLNGVALSTAKSPKCIVQAGYQYSNPSEMLVKIRVTNHDKNAFDVDATAFTLNGSSETLKISPLPAVDPDRYLKDLNSEAELADSRTRMESYQGVEELAALKGDASDSNIDAAKSDYRRKMSEAEDARKAAAEIRKRIAILQPAALRKTTVKPGQSIEGSLIFPAKFGDTGVVSLESSLPTCPIKIPFMLKK